MKVSEKIFFKWFYVLCSKVDSVNKTLIFDDSGES